MPGYRKKTAMLIPLLAMLYGSIAWSGELELNSGTRQANLIELFTSQGCSSCPPAERWLGSLQRDPRLWKEIIPVAFHVDYWDYIGWKDRLAKPAFSERQRRYKGENGLRAVYTPGFLVNGMEWRRWFGLNRIPVSDASTGELQLKLEDKTVQARYRPPTTEVTPLILNVAILGVGLVADIKHGENAGRKLPQDFVVLEYLHRRSPNGQWNIQLPALHPEDGSRLAIAAWVNHADNLKPLQAVGGWLP